MIKESEAVKYFENLYASNAVYLWGANGEKITQQLCDRLYRSFGNGTYTKAYYNNKLKYGQGRIGADCSGSMFPISGFDTTAQGYYDRCPIKGKIGQIPTDKPCLVFKGKNEKKINHIGFYCGNGNVIEMKSSKDDCVKRPLKAGKWDYFGIPAWIDYGSSGGVPVSNPSIYYEAGKTYTLHNNMYVRNAPGGSHIRFEDLTEDGKAHAIKDENGAILRQNTRVTVKDVKTLPDCSVWIQIPSGWICGRGSSGKVYVS